MIVEFKSIIKRDGAQDEIIKFDAPVNLGERQGYKSWEFKEPTRGIMNLIEANDNNVNIFAGAQTIQLKLKDKITNSYFQEGMPVPITFDSFLDEVTQEDNNLSIKYSLWQNGASIGEYNMTLKIK